ncbi:MAG: GH3 auxin-responsive promoter family protein, partial [Chitinophagaceae bacterium]|nr:GH3 auxin-responsive promoter family protein [Chitinophagaceae bacterium]
MAQWIHAGIRRKAAQALAFQDRQLKDLLNKAAQTQFGQDHGFATIKTHADFIKAVPIRDYEALKPYIERVKQGEEHILWPGKPLYFAKTSGTTSGAKYIPITRESMPDHIAAARNALLCYIAETGNSDFVDGNMIFLSGSPVLDTINGILSGRLSGIVNHHVPGYLRKNQLPSYETNCIDDWETKLDAIVSETIDRKMTLISGIPPWMQMYFDRLQVKSGKTITELFPNLRLMVHGGVNVEPYRKRLMESLGKPIDTIETFPASEGFFAFQDSQQAEGLLLNTWSGLFFEFVPAGEIFNETPTRLTLGEVRLGENYALIISSNAGLWAYNIGDTVRFVSLNPYRMVVTGRIKHFISAFGEHVIGEEVEHALLSVANQMGIGITEFTVAPFVSQDGGPSYHEWLIEFQSVPSNLTAFAEAVDAALCLKNVYYNDLITGNILQTLRIRPLQAGAFVNYMKAEGKLGGQNKVPRLSNDRKMAEALAPYS